MKFIPQIMRKIDYSIRLAGVKGYSQELNMDSPARSRLHIKFSDLEENINFQLVNSVMNAAVKHSEIYFKQNGKVYHLNGEELVGKIRDNAMVERV